MDVLTPERFVTAPRPGVGIANPASTLALIGCRTYSIHRDVFDECLHLIELPSSTQCIVESAATSPISTISTKTSTGVWLSNSVVALIDSSDNTLYASDITETSSRWTRIGCFGVPVKSMQIARGDNGSATHMVFSAEVYSDGEITAVQMHDTSDAMTEWKRVKVYDSTFVRHWDSWIYPEKRTQLFVIELNTSGNVSDWSLKAPIRNLLKDTILESPVGPLGTVEDYSISSSHVIFTSKDPYLEPSWHTKQNIYLVPLDASRSPVKVTQGEHGSTSSPVFDHSGTRVAWLQAILDGHECSQKKIIVGRISDDCSIIEQRTMLQDWDSSPSMIRFAGDDTSIIGIVEQVQYKVLFEVDLDDSKKRYDKIRSFAAEGSIEYFQTFKRGVLLTVSSFRWPNNLYFFTPFAWDEPKRGVLSLTDFGQSSVSSLPSLDLGRRSEQFIFPGHNNRNSYGWIHYPPDYEEGSDKKYALVALVHGGPAAAWNNAWSTRWNPLVFAAQGFFVVTIDPAGSTGFGEACKNENRYDWGGAPFNDIVAGVKFILKIFKEIDPERVVAAGNSYGGYMMNWIQGHNQDELFKGLVCHNGIFNLQSVFYCGDELWNTEYEMGGTPWNHQARHLYEKWSPERYADQWETPQLTIACGMDFRLPVTEGIAAFNTLHRRGVPSRLVYFDKENHWVSEPKNSIKWHMEVFSWLLKYSAAKDEVAVK